ncbi:RNA polymerase sigma factor [Niabella beijingensis]|uniref:RNA polymerase sigma factor n=1 Tax=Niabella beijingensis TaxID=2872700 RepID=UPI001CC18AE0|nr:RNA polymerase sigma-70 factor [Niabella beijingensis]MBZ4189877.1 RNA polymerase sigma-70 factor [Niabella beijingensis]
MKKMAIHEQELTERIAEGDEKAFLKVFETYFKELCFFVERYVHSRAMAEDLAQEVFIRIWEHREQLTAVRSFRSYLYTAAKNHTLNALKKASRSAEVMGEIVTAYYQNSNATKEKIQSREYQEQLHRAIENLPARSREIFRLCREHKKTYEEVASLMGISKNAVKNHMVFSMKQLKRTVEAELGISLSLLMTVFFH